MPPTFISMSFHISWICYAMPHRHSSYLVDDGREEEVEEHGGGTDPAGPPEGVVGVEGDGEGDDDEVGQDRSVRVAHQVDVGRHPLVGVVQPPPLRHVQLVELDAAEVDLVEVEGETPVNRTGCYNIPI